MNNLLSTLKLAQLALFFNLELNFQKKMLPKMRLVGLILNADKRIFELPPFMHRVYLYMYSIYMFILTIYFKLANIIKTLKPR